VNILFILIFAALLLFALLLFLGWRGRTLSQYQVRIKRWRALCARLEEEAPVQQTQLEDDPELWLLLKKQVIEAEPGAANEIRPLRKPVGEGLPSLIYINHLPSPVALIPSPSNMGLIVPGISSMLGVLGTFLGIQYGLYTSNLGPSITGSGASNVTSLISGAGELFQSMGTAFWTSLMGLGCALITTIMIARLHRHKDRIRAELWGLQERHFLLCSREAALLMEIRDGMQREASAGLDSPSQQLMIAEIIGQVDELHQSLPHALKG